MATFQSKETDMLYEAVATLESAEECIAVVASALREDYLTKGGQYHHGYEIEDVAVHYCPNPAWAATVRGIYAGIVGRCEA